MLRPLRKRRLNSARRHNSGFALVIALVLMGFLVLLMLSLSTLSMTELMASQQQELQTRARANALLGLQIALGELQDALGPDERISAPATVFDSKAEGRAHWTGAWESNPEGGQAETFLGWLVSLPGGADNKNVDLVLDQTVTWKADSDGTYQPSDRNWVAMVSDATVEVTPGTDGVPPVVMAGVVSTGDNGHYAWWVGDEGVKARVNLPIKVFEQGTNPDDPKNLISQLLSPQYYGLQKMGGKNASDDKPFASIDLKDTTLSQLLSLNQLDLHPDVAGQEISRKYYHDLTTNSQGLLTNTLSGGFRYDLTHLLGQDAAFKRHFGSDPAGGAWDKRYIFTPPSANIGFDYGAPNWGILRSFYRLPASVSNNSLAPFRWISNANTGDMDGKIETTQKPYQHASDVYHINSAVHPLLSWYQFTYRLEFIPERQDDDSVIWRPRLHIRPLVAIYNPYDIPLRGQQYTLFLTPTPLLTIKVGDQQPVSIRTSELGRNHYIRISIPASITDLRPGETRIYGLDGTYPLSQADSVQGTMLKNDNDKTASYYVDLSRKYVSSTMPSGVREARKEGATSSLYHIDDNQNGSEYWGLTAAERERLVYVRDPSAPEEAPYPVVSFTISFRHNGNGAMGDTDTGSRVMFRFGSQTRDIVTSMTNIYRTEDPNLRPKDVVLEEDIRKVGLTTDLFWFGMGMRTTDTAQGHLRQFIDANPRFLTASLIRENKDRLYRANAGISFDQAIISGWTGASIPDTNGEGWLESWSSPDDMSQEIVDGRYIGYFGNSRGVGGSPSVVLYYVPREAPRSLGVFQHAPLGRYSHHQGYIVGNSYAPPRIPPNRIEVEPANGQNVYDWSYVVNLELWDKYFLSTIPQNLNNDQVEDYLSGKLALPNSRFRLTTYDGVPPDASTLTDASNPDTPTEVAKHLVVDGAFNVNSTSVEAWKALLASNANLDIPIFNPTTGGFQKAESESDVVIYRTPYNYESGADTDDTGSAFWSSYRRLTDDELTLLAEEIVKEVKARGPFGSLADFINRRPDSDTEEHRLRGALQAALDRAINKNVSNQAVGGKAVEFSDFATGYSTPEDRKGTGAPGWLLQGDLLQTIGPLLAARSDTFVIRAYGDATDFRGNRLARAWCEAVVQRVPEEVSGGHGRRFVISSFRWINAP